MSLPHRGQQNTNGNRFVWERLLWCSTLPLHLKCLANLMLSFGDIQGGSIFPGVRTLRVCLGHSESSVRGSLAELRQLGLFRQVAERRVDQSGHVHQRPIVEGAGPKGGPGWTVVYQFDPISLTRVQPIGGLSRNPPTTDAQGSSLDPNKGPVSIALSDQCIDQVNRSGVRVQPIGGLISHHPVEQEIDHNKSVTLVERSRRHQEEQQALDDEAMTLILNLSDEARRVLEAAVLVELEEWRGRMSAASFDELVLKALPVELIRYAHSRPLVQAVAALEAERGLPKILAS